jgi:signal transduction histidine kinase
MRSRRKAKSQEWTGGTSEITSALIRFLLVGLISLVLVAVPTVVLFQHIAQEQALKAAIASGRNLANNLLTPETLSGAVANDQAALGQIDSIVRSRMRDKWIFRIKIWDLTGRIIYSDEPALIGRVYALPEAANLLRSNRSGIGDFSSLSDPENVFERGAKELVEVYTIARTSTGENLVFESYFPVSLVKKAQHDLLVQMAPVGLAGLVFLNLAQLPSALHLARRVQHSRRSRERLLMQAVAAADHERRKLAQELHDDVIQDLAGVGYALSSLGEHLDAENAPLVQRIGMTVRRDVGLLRAVVTELYPGNLDPRSLAGSLSELGSALRQAGANVEVDVDQHLALDETTATLVYRVARESLRNAEKHAAPRNVDVRLARADAGTVLTVTDDGHGFEPTAEPVAGHFGLKLIRDTVAEAGGTLLVDSSVGRGTRVELNLPND